jgi:hypothetical protein
MLSSLLIQYFFLTIINFFRNNFLKFEIKMFLNEFLLFDMILTFNQVFQLFNFEIIYS